jgi:hypothetical protein
VNRTAEAIDTGRLRRAVHLDVDRVPDGRFMVTGGSSQAYTVDLDAVIPCTCVDSQMGYRGACKHVLACRLLLADPEVLRALRNVVPIKATSPR